MSLANGYNDVNTCVREALADEQGESKNQNHNMHAILNAGGEGGEVAQ